MTFWIWEITCAMFMACAICFLIEIHRIEKYWATYDEERGLGKDITK